MSNQVNMLLFTTLFAIFLTDVFALPTGWNAGPSSYFGQAGDTDFDYVIVGGGTAGLTVASRLAENPKLTIAVVEAGDFYETVNGNLSIVPGYGGSVSTPAVDWGFKTTPQAALGGRSLSYNRGKAVGGSSATNLMAYHRGTIDSYEFWAKAVGDQSYTFANLLPYFRRSVSYTPPNMSIRAANASVPNPHADAYSSSGGPLDVTHTNWADVVSSYGASAFKEIGIDVLQDLSSGVLIGNQYSPATVRPIDQTRSSSESSFWQASVKSGRNNLKLYTNSMAKKVLFDESKTAIGVSVQTGGKAFTLTATKEVILSAGAFQSPQLLLVSGIGPAATLKSLNIPVIVDSAGVGQNMQDHLFFSMIRQVSVLTEASTLDSAFDTVAVEEYNANATGILTNTGADYFGWEKVPASLESKMSASAKLDLATFPEDWPHYEIVIGDLPFEAGANYAEIIGMLEAPIERGNITISSTDTSDAPVINTNTLGSATDRAVAVALFKRMRALVSTKAMAPIMGPEIIPGTSVQSDDQILQWLLANVGPGYHAACTCTMGKADNPNAVVDSKAKVFGAKNLRVVDASSFALLPPGHLLATVYALAEKIADDVLNGN